MPEAAPDLPIAISARASESMALADSCPASLARRVVIQQQNKRTSVNLKGQVADVKELPGNGWVMAQIVGSTAQPFKIQQRYLRRLTPDVGDQPKAPVPAPAVQPTAADATLPPRPLKVRIAGGCPRSSPCRCKTAGAGVQMASTPPVTVVLFLHSGASRSCAAGWWGDSRCGGRRNSSHPR